MNSLQDSTRRQHNHCFDFIKGIACICVVFMHCEFPGRLGVIVQAVSRFCVPFFFMLSGYYSYYDGGRRYDAHLKIMHIARITVFASLFYFLVAVAWRLVFGESISISSRSVLVDWLVFNQPVVIPSHIWFLFALLYDYILFSFVYKMRLVNFATSMIAVFIIAYINLAQGAHLAGMKIPNMVYRNFLIEGFPLFMIGYWLHSKNDHVTAYCKDGILLLLLSVSTVACLGERMFMRRDFGVNISTFLQVVALFILGMKHPEKYENNIVSRFGSRLSMLIYVLHIFVWRSLNIISRHLQISDNTIFLFLKPILVLFATILISMVVVSCMDKTRLWTANNKRKKAEQDE